MISPDSRKGTHFNRTALGEEETCVDPISASIAVSPKVKIYSGNKGGRSNDPIRDGNGRPAQCVGCDTCSMASGRRKRRRVACSGIVFSCCETSVLPCTQSPFLAHAQCVRCAEPQCKKVCAAGAISKRSSGVVRG